MALAFQPLTSMGDRKKLTTMQPGFGGLLCIWRARKRHRLQMWPDLVPFAIAFVVCGAFVFRIPPVNGLSVQRAKGPAPPSKQSLASQVANLEVTDDDARAALTELRRIGPTLGQQDWDAVVTGLAQRGWWDEIWDLNAFMQRLALPPATVRTTYHAFLDPWGQHGAWESAVTMLDQMRNANVAPSAVTYNHVMNACHNARQWHLVRGFWQQLVQDGAHEGASPNMRTYWFAITAFYQCGLQGDALETFGAYVAAQLHEGRLWIHRGGSGTIDLHFLPSEVAKVAVLWSFDRIFEKMGSNSHKTSKPSLRIITGRGMHSADQKATLLPEIQAFLRDDLRVGYHLSKDGGMITVPWESLCLFEKSLARGV